MRLDPKFFNRFIAICAAITFLAIVFYTIRHSSTQVRDFRNNMEKVQADTLIFYSYTEADSLKLSDLQGAPVVIQFWSTWSGKSQAVNSFLDDFISEYPDLNVIAAVVRDDESLVLEYIENQTYPFLYADGTSFYQTVYVPGLPSQIFINSAGEYVDFHIGDDTTALREKLTQLLQDE
ncbi:MAG: TlpA family protein disulfide reductase [Balneolaceae bacterium]|nr:TlpA family protein disulfide reductase [Balneolaceae bacterium]